MTPLSGSMRCRSAAALATLGVLGVTEPAIARKLSWSGRTWDVRGAGVGEPGPNRWSASSANVRVEDGDLVLSIARNSSGNWTSAEIDGRRSLGYGTYRWVVESDLSSPDPHDVLGMFVWGDDPPSNNEIDIEASRWGNPAWPSGNVTVWQDADAGRSIERTFRYTSRPPYANQFTWAPGRVRFVVSDGTGAKLLDRTVTRGVPVPSNEVPIVNYWRFDDADPPRRSSVRLSSFRWTPLRRSARAGRSSVRLRLSSARLARRPDKTWIRWRASSAARVILTVQHRRAGGDRETVGTLRRRVGAGSGRIRLSGTVGNERLRSGRYRLVAGSPNAGVRFAPGRVRFTVRSG